MPRPVRLFIRLVDALANLGGWFAGVLVLAMSVLILTEIGVRALVGGSTRIAVEYSGYFLAAMVLLSAAYSLREGEHIRVSILREHLGVRGRLWLDRLALLVGTVVTGLLSWALWSLFIDSVRFGVRSFHHSHTPMAIPHGFVLAGAVILCLKFITLLLITWFESVELSQSETAL